MTPGAQARIRAAVAELGDALVAALDAPEPTDRPDELLTIPQAAERLTIARSSLYALIAGGHLRSIKVGRRRVIAASDLSVYLERQRNGG